MVEVKNTYYEYELENGETVKMTLAYYLLLQLKNKNKDLYERYNKVAMNGPKEELDMAALLYTAYICANLNEAQVYDEMDFLMLLGGNRARVSEAVTYLMGKTPKKQPSVTHS